MKKKPKPVKCESCAKTNDCKDYPQCVSDKYEGYEPQKKPGKCDCVWTYDEYHDMYDCECGGAQMFTTGGIKENNYKWCPYCGKKIEKGGE